ncbi:MAG: hypothetical protein HKP41_01535 [Desulfobacterales bacterium]|nr:hypothetical protein [Deltaproteobacteria bacterium]NNK93011.1 hypothetical protein [Desulfobacterales bacterium]
MQRSYLGPEFSSRDNQRTMKKYKTPYHRCADFDVLCREVATLFSEGNAIVWF